MSHSSQDRGASVASRIVEGIIFDIDGTVARGRQILPGVLDTLVELRDRDVRFAFFTNDNSKTIGTWVDRLGDMGIDAKPDEVVTSALVAAEVMVELHPKSRILGVGDAGLMEALETRDLDLVDFSDLVDHDAEGQVDVVMMGRDSNFDARRLDVVCQAIWNGAEFFATNYDPRLPIAGGFMPGTGAMVKAVAYATGCEPVVTGKPSPWSGRMAMRLLGVAPQSGLVVGDQLTTDIAMGRNAGMRTVLVLTGTDGAEEVEKAPAHERPDVVLGGVKDLIPWLDRQV